MSNNISIFSVIFSMKYLLFFLVLYKYFSKTHGSIYLFYLNNNIYLICYYYFIIVYCPLSICLFPLIWFFSVSALHSLQKFPTSSSFSSSSQVQITFSPQPSSSFSHGQITSPPQAPICMFRWIKFTTMLSLSLSLGLSAWVCLCISVLIYLCECVCVCGYLVLLYKVWCGCKLELTNCILF